MADKKVKKVRSQLRRDTAANWEAQNPVLLAGEEILVYTNAGETRRKIGDGVKSYTQLPFDDERIYNALNDKQVKVTGTASQIAGFNASGALEARNLPTAAELGAEPSGSAYLAQVNAEAHADSVLSTHDQNTAAHADIRSALSEKQSKLTGAAGQIVGFDAQGQAQAQDAPKEVMIVTITADSSASSGYVADKTFEEIKAARSNGVSVWAKHEKILIPLLSFSSVFALFVGGTITGDDPYYLFSNTNIAVYRTGAVVVETLKFSVYKKEEMDSRLTSLQPKLTGTAGQIVGFNEQGEAQAQGAPFLPLAGGFLNGFLGVSGGLYVNHPDPENTSKITIDASNMCFGFEGISYIGNLVFTSMTAEDGLTEYPVFCFMGDNPPDGTIVVSGIANPKKYADAANKRYVDAQRPKQRLITIASSGNWEKIITDDDTTQWSQTVIVPGVLADESKQLIQPVPAAASQAAYIEAGIRITGQAADSLIFTADTLPTADISVYIVWQEVQAG